MPLRGAPAGKRPARRPVRASGSSTNSLPGHRLPTFRSFSHDGPQLGTADGSSARAGRSAPGSFAVVLLLPEEREGVHRGRSTDAFDRTGRGRAGFAERAALLRSATGRRSEQKRSISLRCHRRSRPRRRSKWSFLKAGAFRAGVSGAGPVVYGLFAERAADERRSQAAPTPRHHPGAPCPLWSENGLRSHTRAWMGYALAAGQEIPVPEVRDHLLGRLLRTRASCSELVRRGQATSSLLACRAACDPASSQWAATSCARYTSPCSSSSRCASASWFGHHRLCP